MADVAEAAGMSRPALYLRVTNKEALLHLVADALLAVSLDTARRAGAAPPARAHRRGRGRPRSPTPVGPGGGGLRRRLETRRSRPARPQPTPEPRTDPHFDTDPGGTVNDLGPVLITGASSGIGAATAARLTRAGHTVYATARKADALTDLAGAGAQTRSLDVTDDASMRAVVDEIVEAHGRVGGLVN